MSHRYLPADGTGDLPVDVWTVYATGAEGVEAGEQAGLVVVVVADAADEGIPGPAARHASRAVVAHPVADRRARARHRRRPAAIPAPSPTTSTARNSGLNPRHFSRYRSLSIHARTPSLKVNESVGRARTGARDFGVISGSGRAARESAAERRRSLAQGYVDVDVGNGVYP